MIGGSIVALVTPMHGDGSIDWEAMDALLDMHLREGTGAVVSVGTTGESSTLSVKEHCEVIAHTVDKIGGAIPVIAGTGANSTTEAIELTAAALDHGADACLLVTPYYNKPTQEGLYLHHRAVAEAVAIPQILYNVPGRTAVDMKPETVDRLSDIPNIVGLKDATGNLDRARELLACCGGRIDLYSGDDATAMEFMLLGGKGVISVTANVVPRAFRSMCDAALAGDRAVAEAANRPMEALYEALFLEANPIPVKWALHEMGRIPPGIRLPLTPLSEPCREPLRRAMRAAGIRLS